MVAIFVAFMFVGLVLTDLIVAKWQAWRLAHAAWGAGSVVRAKGSFAETLCQVPEGFYLADQHTWIKSGATGAVKLGADPLIACAVGAACRVILPKVGDQVTAGQPLFRLEHNGRAVAIASALTGRVMAVNTRLVDQPGLLNSDPYGNGWVCSLNPTRAEAMSPSAHFGAEAAMWLENEFVRFRDFIFAQVSSDLALGATSQDGGAPATGCLVELGPTAWSAFEENFLREADVPVRVSR